MSRAVEPDWRATVRLQLREELLQGRPSATGGVIEPRTVRVTELLDLRSAYYRRRHPLPPSEEQRLRLEDGRELHAQLGALLASGDDNLEVRVRREGIVGQIDLVEDVPIELKTTGSLPELGSLAGARPQYVEQLAMYCALTQNPRGRLWVVRTEAGAAIEGVAVDVEFRDIEAIWGEMLRRADQLRLSEASASPAGLPRCPWFERGCEFRAAAICACSGTEEPLPALGDRHLVRFAADDARTAGLQAAVRAAPNPRETVVRKYADLLFPRRTYFQRTSPSPEGPPPSWQRSAARDELYRDIVEWIESGALGTVTRRRALHGPIAEPVPCLSGAPYLIKISRSARRGTPSGLLSAQPHYFLELGLRCAAVGAGRGWLILGYELSPTFAEAVWPLEVTFDPLALVADVGRSREQALREALSSARSGELVACPGWMFRDCAYKDRCACDAPESPPNR
ncbi:MAG: hypothetical protein L3K17_09490 [Thermoplasmata archaeon]|nr:hypothetical protein [Thermoplasmata archaeon]